MTNALLDGKIALVTGASRGIGAAAARLFAREGATVVLAARTESDLATLTEEINTSGGTASYVVTDLGEKSQIEAAVAAAVTRYGRLDVALNNGAAATPPHPVEGFPEEAFDLVTRVNYKGVFYAVSAEIAAMRQAGGGSIVNVSSVGSLRGNPWLPAYAAAKRAVNAVTESAAISYGPAGIRVNAIAPGTTLTSMMAAWEAADPGVIDRLVAQAPLGRAARPEEIAEAAAWLLSDRASYVTGVVLPVTGGVGL